VPSLTLHVLSCARACKFWQAFAKSVGSYLALESGLSSEALEDITGCPSVRMAFDDPVVKAQVDSGALFDTLRLCDQVSYAGRGGSWKPVHPRSTHGGALISICHQLFGDSCWTATSTTCMLRVHNSLVQQGCLITCSSPGEDSWSKTGAVPVDGPGLVAGDSRILPSTRYRNAVFFYPEGSVSFASLLNHRARIHCTDGETDECRGQAVADQESVGKVRAWPVRITW
jgi:hypothetical protein